MLKEGELFLVDTVNTRRCCRYQRSEYFGLYIWNYLWI